MECHFKTKASLELYANPVALQAYGGDLGTAVIIFSIVTLDRRRTRKLEIPADQNVWRAPVILSVPRRNRVEPHLKDLAANRISAINKLSFESEGHGFPERPGSATPRHGHPSWNRDAIAGFAASGLFGTMCSHGPACFKVARSLRCELFQKPKTDRYSYRGWLHDFATHDPSSATAAARRGDCNRDGPLPFGAG